MRGRARGSGSGEGDIGNLDDDKLGWIFALSSSGCAGPSPRSPGPDPARGCVTAASGAVGCPAVSPFLISQILASVAFALGILAFQCRARPVLLRTMGVAIGFYATHFVVLGQPAVAAICGVTTVRYFVASYTHDRRLLFAFLGATVLAFGLAPKGPLSAIGLCAASLGTVGSFQSDPSRLRGFKFLCSMLWCIHNGLLGSWVALAMETSFATSNAIGFHRHRHARAHGGPLRSKSPPLAS